MGSNVSTTSLTNEQKGAVMAQIATTLDASDPNADPKEVLNNVKFAAARAVSVEAPGGHEPPMTRSMRR